MSASKIPVQDKGNESLSSNKPFSKTGNKLAKQAQANWRKITVVLAILLIGFLAYGYMSTKNQLNKLADSKAAANSLTAKVGKLAELPTNETPTIATVNDASKLKTQQFFVHAQNGDKLLIFTKSNQAVLYRPSTNKIIQFSAGQLQSSQ